MGPQTEKIRNIVSSWAERQSVVNTYTESTHDSVYTFQQPNGGTCSGRRRLALHDADVLLIPRGILDYFDKIYNFPCSTGLLASKSGPTLQATRLTN